MLAKQAVRAQQPPKTESIDEVKSKGSAGAASPKLVIMAGMMVSLKTPGSQEQHIDWQQQDEENCEQWLKGTIWAAPQKICFAETCALHVLTYLETESEEVVQSERNSHEGGQLVNVSVSHFLYLISLICAK